MPYFYSNPEREQQPYALPDVEVFRADQYLAAKLSEGLEEGAETYSPGWYWWGCLPGCLPMGGPWGPFDSEQEALEDALAC